MRKEVQLVYPGDRLDYPCCHEMLTALYWHTYGKWPSLFKFVASARETKGFCEFFVKQGFEALAIHDPTYMPDPKRHAKPKKELPPWQSEYPDEDAGNAFWCKKRAIFVHAYTGGFDFVCDVARQAEIERLVKLCKETFPLKEAGKSTINFLCEEHGNLQLRESELQPLKKFSLTDNYGETFTRVNAAVLKFINGNGMGLGIFHGQPGTGKSSYIHYLLSKCVIKMIYLPSHMASVIANPGFVKFMLTQGRDSVLVVEDAEQMLLQRDESENPACSNLLNLTDGLLGKAINCRVLCTFNVDKAKLDKALLRKGRLKVDHEFKPLSVVQANKLLRKLRKKLVVSEPTTLADIYNADVDPHCGAEKEIMRVGFAA